MRMFSTCFLFLIATVVYGQDTSLPYYELPDNPEKFTAGNVASRLIDGLGFRYYWATEGLRPEDLTFQSNKDARTTEETISHIYELSLMIVNATKERVNKSTENDSLDFGGMRKATLNNLKTASEILRNASDDEMSSFRIIFQRGDGTTEFPFWNNINGPIADALWHVGQVVSFRRSSGNPFTDRVSLFSGKVKN